MTLSSPLAAGKRRLQSVFVRCALIMAVTTIVVAGILSFQSGRLISEIARDGVVQLAEKTVSLKSKALIAPLRFNALPKIEETLAETLGALDENVVGVIVVGADGAPLAQSEMPPETFEALLDLAGASVSGAVPQRRSKGLLAADPVLLDEGGTVLGAIAVSVTDAQAIAAIGAQRNRILMTAAVTFVAMMALTILVLRRLLGVPLRTLSKTMGLVADGDYDRPVALQSRGDELGEIARSLDGLTKALQAAKAAEDQRIAHAEAQARVVDFLSEGMTALARGALNHPIDEAFPPEYEELRRNYNSAVNALNKAIGAVHDCAGRIRGGAEGIAQSADDLSRRTENQAATLEQTAAALDQLSQNVRDAAGGAKDAGRAVKDARDMASRNGEVMQSAVSAMVEIEKSSDKINEIIAVIDDIAFQTNLLALNAGVEAARAGSSGKGFAVVASEVRALAQRSSDAARQIKELISGSAEQVKSGVKLVDKAGVALDEVVSRVGEIADLVDRIVENASEQSDGLNEINLGVGNLDRVTQENTAMVDDSTASTHALQGYSETLAKLVSQFELSNANAVAHPGPESFAPEGEQSKGKAA